MNRSVYVFSWIYIVQVSGMSNKRNPLMPSSSNPPNYPTEKGTIGDTQPYHYWTFTVHTTLLRGIEQERCKLSATESCGLHL